METAQQWCSFCGKHSGFVKALITSPALPNVSICNECVSNFKLWLDKAEQEAQAQQIANTELSEQNKD